MAKIYTTESKLTPQPHIVSFLLNYSKSLCILETEKYSFEINKN